MRSVLDEILKLRQGKSIAVDYRNTNRYRLVVSEEDGSKTAYYFSTPIYHSKSRKMLDLKFRSNQESFEAIGSNANIVVSNQISMTNQEGSCWILGNDAPVMQSEQELRLGESSVYPTANGVAVKASASVKGAYRLTVEIKEPSFHIQANDRCFALMREKFRPFVVFSCIGTLDHTENLIAPAKMGYQKLTDTRYELTVKPTSPMGKYVFFEANLYENKLFQDTTVESEQPKTNNVFGSVGFIGNTACYGEQWLYSRIDDDRMSEMRNQKIERAILHLPKLNQSKVELSASRVSDRFCSFGSNWNNKNKEAAPIGETKLANGYQSVELTSALVNHQTKKLVKSEGLILRSKVKGSGFSAIATGDSYYAPQILEINFK